MFVKLQMTENLGSVALWRIKSQQWAGRSKSGYWSGRWNQIVLLLLFNPSCSKSYSYSLPILHIPIHSALLPTHSVIPILPLPLLTPSWFFRTDAGGMTIDRTFIWNTCISVCVDFHLVQAPFLLRAEVGFKFKTINYRYVGCCPWVLSVNSWETC